ALSPACQFALPAPRTGPPSAIDGAGRPSCESGFTGSAAKPTLAASAAVASATTGRTRLTVARTVHNVTLASRGQPPTPNPIGFVPIAEDRRAPQHGVATSQVPFERTGDGMSDLQVVELRQLDPKVLSRSAGSRTTL